MSAPKADALPLGHAPALARPAGLEPATFRSEVCNSIQLSYGRAEPSREIGVNDGNRTRDLQGHNLAL
jgi:hypothetical protein